MQMEIESCNDITNIKFIYNNHTTTATTTTTIFSLTLKSITLYIVYLPFVR